MVCIICKKIRASGLYDPGWMHKCHIRYPRGFPGSSVVEKSPADAGDTGLISRLGRSPGVGNVSLLQCSCLGNPMDRGFLGATVHGVSKRFGHT